jgi:SAM-dependent methyltransferase
MSTDLEHPGSPAGRLATPDPEYGLGIRRQFGHPSGVLGWLVGHVMAVKNGERSRWVLDLLDVQPRARVLEVGFGPGIDIRRSAERAGRQGLVAGVDHSTVMVRQASRRNAARIRRGQVELCEGSVSTLPYPDATFDRAFSITSVQFWEDPAAGVRELARVLKPGGVVAVAIQPRSAGATEETSRAWGWRLERLLRDAGFVAVRLETRPTRPVSTVCALGIGSGAARGRTGEALPRMAGASRRGALQSELAARAAERAARAERAAQGTPGVVRGETAG